MDILPLDIGQYESGQLDKGHDEGAEEDGAQVVAYQAPRGLTDGGRHLGLVSAIHNI